jgi:hypothetical protein
MVPSAWRKASKMLSCCSREMPMPVSVTAKAISSDPAGDLQATPPAR